MLEAALDGRGKGESSATTHSGGGGGGRADDIIAGMNEREGRRRMLAEGQEGGKMTGRGAKGGGSSASSPTPLRLTFASFPLSRARLQFRLNFTLSTLFRALRCSIDDSRCLRFPPKAHSRGAVKRLSPYPQLLDDHPSSGFPSPGPFAFDSRRRCSVLPYTERPLEYDLVNCHLRSNLRLPRQPTPLK